ncbi:hypothetical protein HYH02_006394 [Chlamydomonas schloesseri]|uniref:RING-type domain-containing protein n=1 Tax=Chlamydomonas schloesseri TaxID=2026947 RepID=A0A835WJL8_9CHLO|nr:hypothetical protein HYH02_006394 [Chlamydomonas schloesseri]|eukprot:KAG2448503.1 hypothetical protein HYH02_006394 [Chlamydomonas schloesseri]
MPRVPAAKPAVPTVTLVRGGANGKAKPAPPARTVLVAAEQPPAPPSRSEFEKETCPLCVEDLDETDMSFQPCPCGYRMCLFCFEKLKLHCNSVCPNCRRGFGSDEAREYAKQLEAERVQEAMRPKPSAPAPAASTSAASAVASRAPPKPVTAARRDAPPLPAAKRGSTALEDAGSGLPSGVTWANASPTSGLSRNQSVEIERPALSMDESSWPSLGAPTTHQQPQPTRQHLQHHHHQHTNSQGQSSMVASAAGGQQHRHSPSGASEGLNSYDMSGPGTRRSSSVASSMDRAASSSSLELMSQDPPVTPEQLLQLQHQHQQYQAQQAQPVSLSSSSSAFPPLPPPGFEASSSYFGAQVATTINGMRRAVNVPLSLGSSSVEPYPEAPALLASMQQGVAQGTVSSKEAASQLMALLQQKNQDQVAARRPVTKPPPGFGAPAQPAAAAQTQASVAAQGAPLVAARPPPPPGFSHLQGTVVQAPAAARAPIQPPQQTDASGAFGSAAGPIGLNANGTPRTYSMWSGLPGMDLSASTGLSSLWQNLNASALGGLGGGATQPYNPLGMMGGDQAGLAYGGVRAPMAGAPPKAPPPGFGPAAFSGAQAAAGTAQQAGGANSVLGDAFRGANPYRYNPLGQAVSGAYRPPQLGAGL